MSTGTKRIIRLLICFGLAARAMSDAGTNCGGQGLDGLHGNRRAADPVSYLRTSEGLLHYNSCEETHCAHNVPGNALSCISAILGISYSFSVTASR